MSVILTEVPISDLTVVPTSSETQDGKSYALVPITLTPVIDGSEYLQSGLCKKTFRVRVRGLKYLFQIFKELKEDAKRTKKSTSANKKVVTE